MAQSWGLDLGLGVSDSRLGHHSLVAKTSRRALGCGSEAGETGQGWSS